MVPNQHQQHNGVEQYTVYPDVINSNVIYPTQTRQGVQPQYQPQFQLPIAHNNCTPYQQLLQPARSIQISPTTSVPSLLMSASREGRNAASNSFFQEPAQSHLRNFLDLVLSSHWFKESSLEPNSDGESILMRFLALEDSRPPRYHCLFDNCDK
ncbi:hypothetical protein FRC18_003194, partial [Serendipita sp. 400]